MNRLAHNKDVCQTRCVDRAVNLVGLPIKTVARQLGICFAEPATGVAPLADGDHTATGLRLSSLAEERE